MRSKKKSVTNSEVSFDLSISDLMSSLLMVFILFFIVILINSNQVLQSQSEKAKEYRDVQEEILQALKDEFSGDLEEWGAKINEEDLSIRFFNRDILFLPNSEVLRPEFQSILRDFFPRFISVLYPNHQDFIDEIRIEGHTAQDQEAAYLDHMRTSQGRTNNVLRFIITQELIEENTDADKWLKSKITASGFANSDPVMEEGIINQAESRRVEFRIRTNSEELIDELVEIAGASSGE
jgi:outer membrane protein OmpA-like peptidoglycan-associated protein